MPPCVVLSSKSSTCSEMNHLFVRAWAETDACLGGVVRRGEFATTTRVERDGPGVAKLRGGWPAHGQIKLDLLALSTGDYSVHDIIKGVYVNEVGRSNTSGSHTVHENVTVTVESDHVVAIAGAGKMTACSLAEYCCYRQNTSALGKRAGTPEASE
jgi:hypothetical protein